MRCVLLLGLLLIGLLGRAQLMDDFADGEIRSDPPWTGDTADFVVLAGELRSDGPAASSNLGLFTALPVLPAAAEWEWRVRVVLDFDPSSSNYVRIWLAASNPDPEAPGDGYCLQIGESSATRSDSLDLFRSDAGVLTRVCTSVFPVVTSTSSNVMGLRVRRDSLGTWSLWADPGGGEAYAFGGSARDTVHAPLGWFGVQCRYSSSSRRDAYSFDDVYAGLPQRDTTPPFCTALSVLAVDQLSLEFSEALDPASVDDPTQYQVLGGFGTTDLVLWSEDEPDALQLFFPFSFPPDEALVLRVAGPRDLAGNMMLPQDLPFVYSPWRAYDLLLTEILADEEPVGLLPAAEYLEVHNRRSDTVSLEGFVLADGSGSVALPSARLSPRGFLVLCTPADTGLFLDRGIAALGVDGFPALNNGGDDLRLSAPDGTLLHAVSYTDAWYQDPIAEDGGYALEMMDLERPWLGPCNWRAAPAAVQGTPGAANAAVFQDDVPPALLGAVPLDSLTLRALFDEGMDSLSLLNASAWTLLGPDAALPLSSIIPEGPAFTEVLLLLSEALQAGQRYSLTVAGPTDCAGNAVDGTVDLGLPELPDSADVVINEILTDPRPGGVDFVELYNRSARILDLGKLFLVEADVIEPALALDLALVAPAGRLFFPGEYLALCEDPAALLVQYPATPPDRVLEVPDMPGWPDSDDEGIVRLELRDGPQVRVLDAVHYQMDWHLALLDETEGVSLERIDPARSADDPANWHSAAAGVGFATPGRANSNFSEAEQGVEWLTLDAVVFSPDGDGQDDLLRVRYAFAEPGWVANAAVYDQVGRRVAHLAQNELLGSQGWWAWDGVDARGEAAPIGPLIIQATVFHLDGRLRRRKMRAVLARRLDSN